jgi:hypothetical protein
MSSVYFKNPHIIIILLSIGIFIMLLNWLFIKIDYVIAIYLTIIIANCINNYIIINLDDYVTDSDIPD